MGGKNTEVGGEGEQRLSNNELNSYAVAVTIRCDSFLSGPFSYYEITVPVLRECGVEVIKTLAILLLATSTQLVWCIPDPDWPATAPLLVVQDDVDA